MSILSRPRLLTQRSLAQHQRCSAIPSVAYWIHSFRQGAARTLFVKLQFYPGLYSEKKHEAILPRRQCPVSQIRCSSRRQIRAAIWQVIRSLRLFSRLHFPSFYRAMLCIRGTSHGPVSVSVSVRVRLSVTSRSSTKTAKHRITQTTPHDTPNSSFLMPKISAKFDRGYSLRGRRMQVGWVKIGNFRQIAGYISKTVQDRRMVSIKVE